MIFAKPGELTVISVVAELTCARGRRREPSEAEGRRGRAGISMRPSGKGGPVILIFVPAAPEVYACVGERRFAAERSGHAAATRRPDFARGAPGAWAARAALF